MTALYNGLPLFDLSIVDDINGVEAVSLVDFPAIKNDFIKFSEETEVKFSVSEEKRIVSGPVLIPDQKIFRRNDDGYEFYVQFSKESIEAIAQKFFAQSNQTNGNLMHEVDVDGIVYFESYISNKERGLCPVEFADLPDGTWFMSAKIYNDKIWELVKKGVLRGFSIQGSLHIEEHKDEEIGTIEELLKALKD